MYLALPDGPGRFPQGFSCPVVLKKSTKGAHLSYTRLSRAMAFLSMNVLLDAHCTFCPICSLDCQLLQHLTRTGYNLRSHFTLHRNANPRSDPSYTNQV